MSERSPETNFKFGFSFPVLEDDDLQTDEYEISLITDIEKAEVMAYAGRSFEEAAVRLRKLATEALIRAGEIESEMNDDRSFVNQHAQYHTVKAQHYANSALESATTVQTVYQNAETLYDLIQSSKSDGLVFDFYEDEDQDSEMDLQMELPLEEAEDWTTEVPEELPEEEPYEEPAAARHHNLG